MNERHRDPTRSFYDRISHVYDLLADAGEHGAREEGVEALEVAEGERALEIGYGTGHALVELARAVGDEGRVVGIDISGGMADIARKRVDQAGLIERVRIDRGDARDLPYEDGAFDIVFCSFTLELFEDDERPRVLAEIRRVLRPGGRAGIVAMAEPEHRRASVELYKWLHRHFPHIVDCRPIDAAADLAAAGFRVESRTDRAIATLPVAVLTARRE